MCRRPGPSRSTSPLPGLFTSSLPGHSTSSLPGPSTSSLPGHSTSSLPGPSTSSLPGHSTSSLLGPSTSSLPGPSTPAVNPPGKNLTKKVTAMERKIGRKRTRAEAETDDDPSSESDIELFEEFEGKGSRIFELEGLHTALTDLRCKCRGRVIFKENLAEKQGLYTQPYFYCLKCKRRIVIPYSKLGRSVSINRRSVLACKASGSTFAGLERFCALIDLPRPVSKNTFTDHLKTITEELTSHAQFSLITARKEVREHYEAVDDDEVIDVLVSCDGTWQKRGFTSLFGAVFIISFETGKVLDFRVLSKHCASCKFWENKDKTTEVYKEWKSAHQCQINFEGSAGAMEPNGALEMFKFSMEDNIRYTRLFADGDSKTHTMLVEKKPYGDVKIEKCDCIGHVQKRMGTALRKLKASYRGEKLEDGKTIGGQGRLTDGLINSLQNYYGDSIRRNKGNVKAMRAVQASLQHCNSTDEHPRHNLCPEGKGSWCMYQVAKTLGYPHLHKPAIPPAIVKLLRPIYTRLGSKALMEKCVDGYTQNANEALHQLVWKYCPKELFLGRLAVEFACALAVCIFNDGVSSLAGFSEKLQLLPSPFCQSHFKHKDKRRLKSAIHRDSEQVKQQRRVVRCKRKGLNDKHARKEGVMYAAGAFDDTVPD